MALPTMVQWFWILKPGEALGPWPRELGKTRLAGSGAEVTKRVTGP